MKKLATAAVLVLASAFTTTAFAGALPEVISNSQAIQQQPIGVVSVSGISGTPEDATLQLQQKAAKLGGSSIRIVALGTPSDSSLWFGNAQVYR